jgi:BirA family biotin operon repressor/biotin-[acetyl-CoA-carboxylase] ligase
VEGRYERLKAGDLPHVEWMESLVTVGQDVVVSSADEVVEGLAERVDPDGALLVRLANGRLRKVVAADVSLRTWGHDGCA